MELDEFERNRQAAKRQRTEDDLCHPFGRHLPPAGDQLVFDDGAPTATIVIAIAGGLDKLGIPAVQFFDLIDRPARRVYIRSLILSLPPFSNSHHPLGDTVEQVQGSLHRMIAGHRNVVLVGTSIGGYFALLLGALLGASTVIAAYPTTTLVPERRAAFGDGRAPGHMDRYPRGFLDAFGDIPTVLRASPPKRVVVHYCYRDDVSRNHAEHLAGIPQVQLVPHFEHQVMHKIAADGTLRVLLHDTLDPLNQLATTTVAAT